MDFTGFITSMPSIISEAVSMKFVFNTFETNGKLLDARRLHSITFMSLSFARNCMLNGPDMFSSSEILLLIFFILLIVSMYSFCAGNTIVASPECTPANSMCSDIAYAIISPLFATASISSSFAFSMNSETTTGYFFETFEARLRNCSSSESFDTMFIAAPDST